jgi:NAD(P)-dependent dehydrogenase (short-subunit alcohol dehydrogenase family)
MTSGPLAGRVAIVTGGATGIGLATSRALAADGATVFLAARDVARAAAAATEGAAAGLDMRPMALDVRDAGAVSAAIAVVAADAGRLDILVNNAGVPCVGRVEDLTEEAWDDCLDTNLKGAFLCARAAIPVIRTSGGGSIVNVASNAGLVARAEEPAYATSKAGMLMLTRSLALAHAADRIRVNAVCPGPVGGTGIMDRDLESAADPAAALAGFMSRSPLAAAYGRLIEPGEVAALIRYLCSDAASMITGATIAIDGGKSAAGPL